MSAGVSTSVPPVACDVLWEVGVRALDSRESLPAVAEVPDVPRVRRLAVLAAASDGIAATAADTSASRAKEAGSCASGTVPALSSAATPFC